MSLKLYYQSFCHKVLIAFYETGVPFEPIFVDLGDEKSSAPFRALWPIAKFPVLRDEARNCTVPESTVIINYLGTHYAGGTRLLPADVDQAWQVQMPLAKTFFSPSFGMLADRFGVNWKVIVSQ